MSRIAEITAIILCTCFPILLRSLTLVRDRFSDLHSPLPPKPIQRIRKSRIFKVGSAQSSLGTGSGVVPQDVDMAWLKSPYQQLGDKPGERSVERQDVVRDLGSKKAVGVRMASWDQLNAKSRVASMV